MALTIDQVRKVALLADLELSPSEERALVEELGTLLEYIDQLETYDLESESPAPHDIPRRAPSPEADDRPSPSLPQQQVLDAAPTVRGEFIVVPAIRRSATGGPEND